MRVNRDQLLTRNDRAGNLKTQQITTTTTTNATLVTTGSHNLSTTSTHNKCITKGMQKKTWRFLHGNLSS
jgi:hypothetical protein